MSVVFQFQPTALSEEFFALRARDSVGVQV